MSIMQSLVDVEMMTEEEVKGKYGVSSANVKKVLKVLLVEELTTETKKPDKKEGETPAVEGSGATENRRKRKNNVETTSETPENVN